MHDERLVDEIYEAAVVPDRWGDVLQRVGDISGSFAGGLITIDPRQRPRAMSTESYRPIYESFRRGELFRYENVRAQRAAARRHPGFLRDIDLCTLEELAADQLYRHFLHPHGLGWTVGTLVDTPTRDMVIFDFARRTDDGPFDLDQVAVLDALRPHLARAAFLSARFGLERSATMADAMSSLGLPAAVLGPYATIVATNPAFEAVAARVEPILHGKRVGDPMFGTDTVDPRTAISRSIPIAGEGSEPPLVVHLLPVRRGARDVFSGASAIAVVTTIATPAAPSVEIIATLFDLSPAEARVAQAIAEGKTIESHAGETGLSIETVRKQVKSAMAKTDTHRQVDLVRLLLGASGVALQP